MGLRSSAVDPVVDLRVKKVSAWRLLPLRPCSGREAKVRCVFARVPLTWQSILTPPEGATPVDQGPLLLHKVVVMSFQLGDFILGHVIDVTAQMVREGRFHEVVHCVLDLDILSFQVATLAFGDSTLRLNKFGQSENGIDWQTAALPSQPRPRTAAKAPQRQMTTAAYRR